MGWDDSAPKPVRPAQTRVAAFNVKLVNQSRLSTHPLASVDPKTVKYGSLAASHTNAVLRMFKDGVRHEAAESIMGSPQLSPEGLKAHDAGFYNAGCNGLEWTVIGPLAVRTWPNLTQLLCETSNTNGQLQRQGSELQLAKRIFNVIESMGPGVDFKVKGRILRSKPLCASSVPHLFKFLLKFGGGSGCSLFFESCDFLKCSKTSQRILGHDFWELLSQDCKTPGVLLPLTRHAILRVALAHLNPRYITLSDVRKILSQGMLQASSDVKHHKALKLFVCEKIFSWKNFSFTQAASNLTKVIWQFSQSLKLCRSFFSLAQIKKCFQMTRTIREVFTRIWQVAHIEVYQVYCHTIESYICQIICCIYAI